MEKVRGVYLNKRTLGMILLGIALTATLLVGFFGIRYEDQLEQACHVLLVLTLAAVLSALLVICARPKIRPENLFLLLVILFGLLFMVAITPLAVPDEYHHYLSTLSQTSKVLYGKCQADAAYLNVDDISIHNISYETFQNMLNGLFNEGISGQIKTFDDEAAGYPVQYAPQMVGMGLAMLLHLNRYWVFLLGDFTNLLFYAAVTYAAIRRIPVGKVPMMIVALLPMSMQQASSYSSDAFINAMAFLLVAEVVRAIVGNGKLPWQSMLAIGLVGVLLAPAKGVYAVLLMMLIMIPKERFSSSRARWGFLIGLLTVSVAAVAWTYRAWFAERLGVAATNPEAEETTGYTFAWLLTHPLQVAAILLRTLVEAGPDFYLDTMVGYALAGLTMYINHGWVNMFVILMAVTAIVGQPGEEPMPKKVRVFGLCVALLCLLAVMGSMLVGWTTFGAETVEGVQGRYLLPIAPLALLCLRGDLCVPKRSTLRLSGAVTAVLLGLTLMNIVDFLLMM